MANILNVIRLVSMTLYPVKSLDGVDVTEATILRSGAFAHDREYSMWDADGRIVNGKREARIHRLRSSYDSTRGILSLGAEDGMPPEEFRLPDDLRNLEAWLSRHLGYRVLVRRDTRTGFPDDPSACGPTIISTASLAAVASWFPGLDRSETRRRFRANIEIGAIDHATPADAAPFWEDRLAADDGRPVRLQIGHVLLEGLHLCPRCAVPSRDPQTGVEIDRFQRTFSERRKATLPPWAPAARFDHFYYLSASTRVPASEAGKTLRVGDEVRLLDEDP